MIHNSTSLNFVPKVFDIQAEEFSSEWQHNVIHGYTSRKIELGEHSKESIKVRIHLLDSGLVMRDLLVK